MLTGYSEKPIKGVAASEVPEVSLLYACIDLNSHSEHVLIMPYMCRIDTKKRRAIASVRSTWNKCVTRAAQILGAVYSMYVINTANSDDKTSFS